MDTQNREKSAGVPKFPEPRGWAMKWVFTQEMALPTVEQRTEENNPLKEKFVEPRGWAMKWDGLALSEAGKQRDGHDSSSR